MTISIEIEGMEYSGWTSANVKLSLTTFPATFQMDATENSPGTTSPITVAPGAPCIVRVDGEVVITGFVGSFDASLSATSHTIRLSGRSVCADIRDCAAIVPGGQIKNKTLDEVATQLCAPFGVPVTVETDMGEPFPDVQIEQGETCYDILEKLCRLREVLVIDTGDGTLTLTRAGEGRAAGALRQGRNVLQASCGLSFEERFSDYIVKGQQAMSDEVNGATAHQVRGDVRDCAVPRYRPMIVLLEDQGDEATARARADWEARARLARGLKVSAKVQGWRDDNGALWRPNTNVFIDMPYIRLSREMLISDVSFSISNGGTITDLTLSLPDAFTPEPSADSNADAGDTPWQAEICSA